jgi:hypothetical protein
MGAGATFEQSLAGLEAAGRSSRELNALRQTAAAAILAMACALGSAWL